MVDGFTCLEIFEKSVRTAFGEPLARSFAKKIDFVSKSTFPFSHQKSEGPIWSVLQAIYTIHVLLVFASILMHPWNNSGNSIKEMALVGRSEPYGQRKCLRLESQSLAGLPSDRLPHRELPDLCAEHF